MAESKFNPLDMFNPLNLVTSLFSGFMSSKSSKKAAQAQEQMTMAQIQAQKESEARYYAEQERVRSLLMPYVNSGYEALGYNAGEIAAINNNYKNMAREVQAERPGAQMNEDGSVVDERGAVVIPPKSDFERQLDSQYGPVSATTAEAFAGGPRPTIQLGRSETMGHVAAIRAGANLPGFPELKKKIQAQETWDARYRDFQSRQQGPQDPTSFEAQATPAPATNDEWSQTLQDQIAAGDTVTPAPRDYANYQRQKPSTGGPTPSGSVQLEKPSFEGGIQNPNGSFAGSYDTNAPTSLKTFQQGAQRSNPMLDTLLSAGTREMPRLSQYAESGVQANDMQAALSGIQGPDAQQAAYAMVESDPAYTYQMQKAEEAMTQNAAATGGVRGGNVQGALAEFRPAFLSNAINQRFNQLAPIASRGANVSQYITGTGGNAAQNLYSGAQSATGQKASMGLSAITQQPMGTPGTTPVANMIAQQGAIRAGGEMGQANAWTGALNQGLQNYFTGKELGWFGNNQGGGQPSYMDPNIDTTTPYGPANQFDMNQFSGMSQYGNNLQVDINNPNL